MESHFIFLPFLLLALMILGGMMFLLVAILVAGRGTPGKRFRPTAVPSPPLDRRTRVEILRELAAHRITVGEAGARLADLGNPVPAALSLGTATRSTDHRGRLVAVTLALTVVGILVLGSVIVRSWSFRGVHAGFITEFQQALDQESVRLEDYVTVEQPPAPPEPPEAEVTDETIETWEKETE